MASDSKPTWLTDPESFAKTTFDYLVIGGGTAGLALASRLAENREYKIGVIDAESYLPDDPRINLPEYRLHALSDHSYTWQLATTPQEHAQNRTIPLPSGNVLGGSSAINAMVFMRASKAYYDNWEALGNPGWNWDGLLPYFTKSEKHAPQTHEDTIPGVELSDEQRAKEYHDI